MPIHLMERTNTNRHQRYKKRGESMRFATCCLNRRRRKWILALFAGGILLLAGFVCAQWVARQVPEYRLRQIVKPASNQMDPERSPDAAASHELALARASLPAVAGDATAESRSQAGVAMAFE